MLYITKNISTTIQMEYWKNFTNAFIELHHLRALIYVGTFELFLRGIIIVIIFIGKIMHLCRHRLLGFCSAN
jgi:hypothetical protein